MHSHWAANASSWPFSPSSTSLQQRQATLQPVHEPQCGLMPEGNCHAAEPSQAVHTYPGSSAAEQACTPLPVLGCVAYHLLQNGHSGVCAAAGAAHAHSVGIWRCGAGGREGARGKAASWAVAGIAVKLACELTARRAPCCPTSPSATSCSPAHMPWCPRQSGQSRRSAAWHVVRPRGRLAPDTLPPWRLLGAGAKQRLPGYQATSSPAGQLSLGPLAAGAPTTEAAGACHGGAKKGRSVRHSTRVLPLRTACARFAAFADRQHCQLLRALSAHLMSAGSKHPCLRLAVHEGSGHKPGTGILLTQVRLLGGDGQGFGAAQPPLIVRICSRQSQGAAGTWLQQLSSP